MRPKSLVSSFQHAIDGILHAYRTQRHFRFHVMMIIPALILARLLDFDRQKMILLSFTISLVLICEMLNTALEVAVDLFTDKYHPLAKHCKDIAAGAVLISSVNAMVVGSFLFFDEKALKEQMTGIVDGLITESETSDLLSILVTTAIIILTLVFIWKVWGKKGTPLQGGVVSGHSALAFFMACVIVVTSSSWTVWVMAILLALLVSQSRVEGNIHTLRETIFGAVLGILVTLIIFQVLPRIMESFVR